MNRWLLLILLPLSFFMSCSTNDDLAGGTSSSDNAKVMGTTTDSLGNPIKNVTITIAEASYNPQTKEDTLFSITTDAKGNYSINLPKEKEFVFTIVNGSTGTIEAFTTDRDTIQLSSTLLKEGNVELYLPKENVTTSDSYYIAGTPFGGKVTIIDTIDSYAVISLKELPVGTIPQIVFPKTAVKQISIESGTTIKVTSGSTSAKPIWHFPLLVAVKDTVATHFGGLDSFTIKLQNHLIEVNRLLDHPKLDGKILFTTDSVSTYTFSSTISDEGKLPQPPFAYHLLYSEKNDYRAYHNNVDYMYLYAPSLNFFQEWDKHLLAQLFANARGAFQTYSEKVNPSDTPIKHNGYTPPPSLMNNENESQELDDYTISLLNMSQDILGNRKSIVEESLPDSLQITITKQQSPISGVKVTLYRSLMESLTLEETSVDSLITDDKGTITFPTQYYRNSHSIAYGTILLFFTIDGKAYHHWLPLHERGEKWFKTYSKLENVEIDIE